MRIWVVKVKNREKIYIIIEMYVKEFLLDMLEMKLN